ncbi:vacuolar fusion protein CCZ1-like protein [Dinothrombium tinctorium]|uniref:Vacuolar fusion protein CCZ1-like protein n=1 Tax=Dinothrombium tinctorium TaxID=1965070 RepID=A0A3S3QH55_9ACAR|nr:vacuolar fusion protein CCZ1-like protein [Dinothrombium tinctorium]RWS08698.1 vacuolar fusion protein CCZ1-like protein [Dinothrombium tinctorium]
MSQIKQRFSAKIVRFIVFNDKWGPKEGEEIQKLIYFQTNEAKKGEKDERFAEMNGDLNLDCSKPEIQTIINDIGLCECVVRFVKNFGENEEVKSVHGSKVRLVLEEVEPDFWMCLSLSVPRSVIKTTLNKDDQIEQQIIEYHDEELNDYFVKLLIKQIYETFFLLNGSLREIWKQKLESLHALRQVCSQFFGWFLPSIKAFSVNLIELFGAIQYLPLDNITFLEAQSFVNHVMFCDPLCEHIMFLYNEQLISSSLDLKNTRVIYRYLVSVIIPEAASEEMSESFRTRTKRKTRYVKTGVRIHLFGVKKSLLMNIYRSVHGTTVVLFFSDKDTSTSVALSKCDLFMSSRLHDLSTKLGEVSVRVNSQEQQLSYSSHQDPLQPDFFKFAYFNGSNSAFKSNSGSGGILDHRKISDSEFVKLIIDIESDLRTVLSLKDASNVIEIVAKTTNESWLVVHQSDARTIFSLLNHKNANLVEASEAVALHMAKQFSNILFID